MKRIFVIRHTTPNIDAGICYGVTDLNTASTYLNEYENIKARLKNFNPDAIYSSPLKRCRNLASNVYSNKVITTTNDLCEINFGDWEMVHWNKIPIKDINAWTADLYYYKIPNGESFKDLYTRVLKFWNETIVNHPSESIAIFTHSGVLRALLMKLLDITPNKIFNLKIPYGAIIEIEYYCKDYSTVKFI
ncbi:MAG: alpha-ribazole phosphatase [Marinilabiliaceae bacterium]|nr:alpha-ribazole phosphatase [Marinilabiliaceae bacterium]